MNTALIHAGIVAALTPQKARVASSRFSPDGAVLHIVSFDGEYYLAEPLELDWLRKGYTPQELELLRSPYDSFSSEGDEEYAFKSQWTISTNGNVGP